MALAARLLVTGALHEDGLADFCDGFGGGTSRDKILSIMKDSHIGTYGVLGLLFYYGLMWNILTTLSVPLACAAILSGDAWSKFCAAQIINTLPYARKEEESKAKVIYDRIAQVFYYPLLWPEPYLCFYYWIKDTGGQPSLLL